MQQPKSNQFLLSSQDEASPLILLFSTVIPMLRQLVGGLEQAVGSTPSSGAAALAER